MTELSNHARLALMQLADKGYKDYRTAPRFVVASTSHVGLQTFNELEAAFHGRPPVTLTEYWRIINDRVV